MGNRPQQVAPVPFVFRLLPIPQPFLRPPGTDRRRGRAFQHGPQELFLIFSKLLSRLRRNPQKTEPAFTAVDRPYTVFAVSEAVAVGVLQPLRQGCFRNAGIVKPDQLRARLEHVADALDGSPGRFPPCFLFPTGGWSEHTTPGFPFPAGRSPARFSSHGRSGHW